MRKEAVIAALISVPLIGLLLYYVYTRAVAGALAPAPAPAEEFLTLSDDFNDGVIDPDKWEKVIWNEDVTSETAGVLRVDLTGKFTVGGGVASTKAYNVDESTIEVTITPAVPTNTCRLILSTTKKTDGQPNMEPNEYNVCWIVAVPRIYFYKRVGGVQTNIRLLDEAMASPWKVKVVISAGGISMYIDRGAGYEFFASDPYQFKGSDMFIHLFSEVGAGGGNTLTDFDNFSLRAKKKS